MMEPLVKIENLVKSYRMPDGVVRTIVDIPAYTIAPRAQQAIRGRSGSGKTTFLNLISGITAADRGRILLDGVDVTQMTGPERDRLRAAAIGCIFQSFNLMPGYRALENVELAMMLAGRPDRDWARHLLERVGLSDRLHHRPGQLSAGQQQRVAIARALANRPRLILADEPTGSLDANTGQIVMELIRALCRDTGTALLVVSHDSETLDLFENVETFSVLNRASNHGATEVTP